MTWIAMVAAIVTLPAGAETDTGSQDTCRTVFDFDAPESGAAWKTTNDNVMGGKSSGGSSVEAGALIFSGVTNTDGGGFSSIKAAVPRRSLTDTDFFRLRYRGDGRRYQLSAETNERRRLVFRIQYWSEFEAQTGEDWKEVDVPVSDFRAHVFGEQIDDRRLDPSRIRNVGFFIYDKKDGPFRLEVDEIKACSGSSDTQ